MGRNYFTDEQMVELKQSPYVEKISKANVQFTLAFKQKFYGLLLDGNGPSSAFILLGINLMSFYCYLCIIYKIQKNKYIFSNG